MAVFRAGRELAYALLCLPLALVGLVYVVASLAVGAALAVTFLGLPLLAAALAGARGLGALHRTLAATLLDTRVEAPRRRQRRPGFLGRIGPALSDPAGWRAVAYLLLALPAALAGFAVAAFTWAYGLFFLGYPALRYTMPVDHDSRGAPHHGLKLWVEFWFDSVPRSLLLAVLGAALLYLAPRLTHAALWPARRLVRGLLGPTATDRRVADLEQTRTIAVDDSAAVLRRIERDLHDGAQARLVAMAMKLGLAKETLDGDDPATAVVNARALVDTAHQGAKEALAELRDLARGIHPPVLDRGLDAALATLAARSAVPATVRVDLPVRPSPAVETIAYFCTAELLTNVAKHAGARRVAVEVGQPAGVLRLRVTDDGAGGARLTRDVGHSGLAGLADRVRTVDGRLHIDSPAGGPTVITVELPAAPAPRAAEVQP
jgi:signal transduction histidine kinase